MKESDSQYVFKLLWDKWFQDTSAYIIELKGSDLFTPIGEVLKEAMLTIGDFKLFCNESAQLVYDPQNVVKSPI